jgi:hypothetical protein
MIEVENRTERYGGKGWRSAPARMSPPRAGHATAALLVGTALLSSRGITRPPTATTPNTTSPSDQGYPGSLEGAMTR